MSSLGSTWDQVEINFPVGICKRYEVVTGTYPETANSQHLNF
jgi:hypothetical protein